MRFLLDENLSPSMVEHLASAGLEALHVRDVGLQRATDEVIMAWAARDGWVLADDLEEGAMVVLEPERVRVRRLPL